MTPTPHSRSKHLFVVLRVDDASVSEKLEDRIYLVSAYYHQPDALAEAERLNRLNGGKNDRYIVELTRLKSDAGPCPLAPAD